MEKIVFECKPCKLSKPADPEDRNPCPICGKQMAPKK